MVEESEHVHWTSDETAVSLSSDTSIASQSLYEDEVFDDEMEVTGFAFGTVALVGPLASACLSAYGLLRDMKSINNDAADFRLLVDTQMGLLSLWVKTWVHFDPVDGEATNPVSRNGKLRSGVIGSIGEENCLLVVRILAKISKTLGDAITLQNLYGIQLTPFPTHETARTSESSRSRNKKVQVQVLPANSFSARTDSSVQSPVTAATSSNISGSRRKTGSNVRSWFSRVNCLQLCSPGKRNKPSTKQKHASITYTPNEKPQKQRNYPNASGMDTTVSDIEVNPAALEALRTEIVDNLTKIQCLKWVLSDKNKGMLLAQELQHWNDNLFKILPLKRIETPAKIRAGRHYTMPQSSPIFTGRAAALNMLEDIFFSNEPQPRQRRAVIHGLGGAGKTQIVLKFAEEHLDRFDSIFWIDASSDNTVEDSFREIAEHLKVTGRHLTAAVKHRLSSIYDYNYLLIFDNADNLPSLSTYFPGGKHGNILVTSRNPRTRDIVSKPDKHTLEVDKMSHSDAYEFLLKAARLSPDEVVRPAIEKSARLIIEKLGYLALAIDQAGAYIANTCSIQDYLAIYDTMRPILMSTREFQGSGYAASVYQTWELSLEAVEQKSPAAAELLKVLGYFHYEGIPREIFEAGSLVFARASQTVGKQSLSPLATLLAECIRCDSATKNNSTGTWVAYPFDQTIKILCNYSLVKKYFTGDGSGSPCYTIHPLVHCWIRDRSERNVLQRQRAQSIAIALLQEAMLKDEKEGGYVLRNQLVSHLDAWIRPYLDTDTVSDPNWVIGHNEEERIAVLEAAAETYHDAGRLDDAQELRERVLRWRVENLGVNDPDTARARINLAMTYRRKGYVQKAMHLDEETLQLFLHSDDKGPEHDETLQAMLNLAWTYAEAGMISEAEQLERQVITVRTKLLGSDSFEVAIARGNLGVTLWRMGRHEEAEEEYKIALEHKVAVYGRDNPSTILTIGNLASAMRGQKRWKSSENLGREVVELRKQKLGERHQDVARGMAHIGVTYLEAGRAQEALDIQINSLEVLRETVGDYHPHTLDTMENLSRVFIQLGQEKEAAETLGDLVGKRKMVLGETHPRTLDTMKMLGELQGHEGVLDEVREIEAKEAERKKSVANIKDPEIHDLEGEEAKKVVDNEIHRERKQRREELAATGIRSDRWNVLLECAQAPVVEAS